MDEAEGSQSIMPAALPLHYGNTTQHPQADCYILPELSLEECLAVKTSCF